MLVTPAFAQGGALGGDNMLVQLLPFVLIFVIMYFLILRPVKKQALAAFRELPGKLSPRSAIAAAGGKGILDEAGQPLVEGPRADQLKKMLTDKVKAEPAAAGRLVESWVREGQDK